MSDAPSFEKLIEDTVKRTVASLIENPECFVQPEWLTSAQAAAYLGLTDKGMEEMRRTGRGPRFSRPSHRVLRYRKADLDAYLEAHLTQPGENAR